MWIILVDDASENHVHVGSTSHNFDPKTQLPFEFRMRDDDGHILYRGKSNNNSSFEPLDVLGMPDAGCTEIQYLEHGRWETL